MKNYFFTLTLLAASIFMIACDDDTDDLRISYKDVPETAQNFMQHHIANFNESSIRYIEIDESGTYEVRLRDNIEIGFYSNGVWKEIDLNNNPLPESIAMLLPANALNYIAATYPTGVIEEIEKTGVYSAEGQGFKIELRNDRDIYFDAAGNVLTDNGNPGKGKENIQTNELPAISREFLNTYFAGLTPVKIEKEWDKYEVEFNIGSNDIEVEFFATSGAFKSVEVDNNNTLIRNIINGVSGSTAITDYLNANHSGSNLDQFSLLVAGTVVREGYVVETDGKPDYKIYFDKNGTHILTVKD